MKYIEETMFNKAVKNVAVLLLGSFMMLGNASAQNLKIAYVDYQAVAQQLPQMAAIEQTVKAEFKERMEAIKKLEADYKFNMEKLKREQATMSTAEQDELKKSILAQRKDLEAKAAPLQQQMQRRAAEEQNKVMAKVQQAVEQISKDAGYDIILRRESIAFTSMADKLDISNKVADKVKSQN